MPKKSRNITHQKNMRKKFGFLRFLVIVLSFISLISRVIYCTFATWLTVTTFDCIPCAISTSAANASSDLFIQHHSSAVFKTVRSLNVGSLSKSRPKRSLDVNDLTKLVTNYSQFFTIEDINPQNQTFNKTNRSLDIETIGQQIPNNSISDESKEFIESLFQRGFELKDFLKGNSQNKTDPISSFFGEESVNQDPFVVPIVSATDGKSGKDIAFERFTYIPSDDLLDIVRNVTNEINLSTDLSTDLPTNLSTNSKTNFFFNTSASNNNSESNTMIIELETNPSNSSEEEPISHLDAQLVNNTETSLKSDIKKTQMNVCSEDCAQFLNIELSDPDVRKWATVVITGVLYLYAFVMFCIFISTCMALVDLLVVSTFIEGAKLFAGFILIIIDSFNGKELHFDLIDIKFNVSPGGNGWTADFSYSEYLLDIIIFFLSAYLSIRVFKCFDRLPKKVSSIEELVDNSRGTYRPNPSRNSLEPIYEIN